MKSIFSCVALLTSFMATAQPLNVVPAPAEYKMGKSFVKIDNKTIIIAKTTGEKKIAALFNEYLAPIAGYKLSIGSASKTTPIRFTINKKKESPGGYQLDVQEKEILISGTDAAGLFYGMQTLIQLLPVNKIQNDLQTNYPLSIPQLSIKDHPRFPYRGMHFDVARHFSSVAFVKKYIDYLAMYKFNTFHWHLTDDQGWRIEIKKYPLLTQIGGYRAQTLVGRYGSDEYDGKRYGGFYTQEEIKEVVKYAADRFINVIPEIEMPGHALAALASYPYLGCTKGPYKVAETWGVFDDVFCAGNDSTFTFMQNVLDEVLALFPSKLIHIGGDESPKTRWKTCPDCQKRISDEKLKDEHELQSYFITRIEKYLNSKGRNIIGWDEILEGGLAPNATVMSWRGEEGGITAAKQHHNVVMTPGNYLYFDHSQSNNEDSVTFGGFNSLEKVYSYEPIPAALSAEEGKYILGAQANLWTEYITNPKKVEYQLFPRIAALSEVLWSPKEKRNWEDFERKLPVIFERYQQEGINYSTAYYNLELSVSSPETQIGVYWNFKKKKPGIDNMIRIRGALLSDTAVTVATYDKEGKQIGVKVINSFPTYTVLPVFDSREGANVLITESMLAEARLIQYGDTSGVPAFEYGSPLKFFSQKFFINKATSKQVSLTSQPSDSYKSNGAFTLVDGIRNTSGMSKPSQFLGFSGDDLEATIDLGNSQSIKNITLRVFEQTVSWIYRPQFVSFYTSENGKDFQLLGNAISNENNRHLLYSFEKPVKARYIRIYAKNYGVIQGNNPGAGNKAWLFVDEVEVN